MSDTAKRVVIIDDDEDLLFATGLALESGGFASAGYTTCDAAARALEASGTAPWAVLLDMHLSEGMSPAEFIHWLKEHGMGDVPVLLVTAATDAAQTAAQLGAKGYLAKPYPIAELIRRVSELRR